MGIDRFKGTPVEFRCKPTAEGVGLAGGREGTELGGTGAEES